VQVESIRSIGASDTVTKPTEPTDETRLAMLADLLAALPVADLPPADRVAIARKLMD